MVNRIDYGIRGEIIDYGIRGEIFAKPFSKYELYKHPDFERIKSTICAANDFAKSENEEEIKELRGELVEVRRLLKAKEVGWLSYT